MNTPLQNGDDQKVIDLPLDQLVIGTSQVRTDLNAGIDELAQSIRKQGLLQPIVVARAGTGKFEILAGQRRFLAHQKLGRETIRAVVHEGELDDVTRVAISLTENLVRRENSPKELIDACTKLYKQYGSIKMVSEETGLPANLVSRYIKYDQLIPALKEKVDKSQLDMKVALQAQKAAMSEDGAVDEDAAVKYASEMSPMSNVQREHFARSVVSDPTASVEERIERGLEQPKVKQIVVTLEESLHRSLSSYAKGEGINQDEAAVTLIEDGLVRRGINGD